MSTMEQPFGMDKMPHQGMPSGEMTPLPEVARLENPEFGTFVPFGPDKAELERIAEIRAKEDTKHDYVVRDFGVRINKVDQVGGMDVVEDGPMGWDEIPGSFSIWKTEKTN